LVVEEISEPEIDLGIAGSFRKLEIDWFYWIWEVL
jgi:hypothetical protein